MSTILDAALAHVGDGVLTAHGYAYLGALCGKLEARADGWQDSPPASDRIGAVMDHAIDDVLSDCLPESMAPLAPVLRLAAPFRLKPGLRAVFFQFLPANLRGHPGPERVGFAAD